MTEPKKKAESETKTEPGEAPGSHYYRLTIPVCSKDEDGCTVDRVYEFLRRRPAPGADGNTPVNKGSETNVYGLGPVEHDVDPDKRTVTNTTKKTHRLHPGKVTHQVKEREGHVEIETTGIGTGPHPWANEFLAPLLWGSHVNGIRDEIFGRKEKDPPDWTQ